MNSVHINVEHFDFNLLKIFETVYREQHLSRAAESLALTPSAVSHAVRRLREQLNDDLFVRDGRSMQPTPTCQRMAPALLDQLAKLRQLLQQWGQFDPLQTHQTFRIGVPDAIEPLFLPALASVIRKQAPHAALTSLPLERKNMAGALANGQLDVVIDVAQPISGSVRHQPLFEDEFRIVTRRDHPVGRRLALPGYMKAEHVAVSTRAKGAVVEDIALLNLGLQRRIGVRCQNYHAACRLVAQSDYMLTMPARLARHIDAQQSLKHWALPFSLPPVHLHLYWHTNSEADSANLWLRRLIVGIDL